MARPKVHDSAAARRAAFLQTRDRFDLTTSKVVGETIRDLAATFDASHSDVINDLLKFALLNRNWKQQGLLWTAHKDDGGKKG